MFNYAINNETEASANLPPFLTNNLIFGRYEAMAKKSIPSDDYNSQPLKKCTKCKKDKYVSEFSIDRQKNDGLRSHCKECDRIHYRKNKEHILGEHKIWRSKNKDYCRDYMISYSKTLKEKDPIGFKRYNAEKTVKWRKENPDKAKDLSDRCHNKRRALKLKVIHETFNVSEIFKRDGYICQLCGRKTRPDYKNPNHPLYPNLDHIIPLSKGGGHTKKNTQCLCHQCNIEKRNTVKGDQLRIF